MRDDDLFGLKRLPPDVTEAIEAKWMQISREMEPFLRERVTGPVEAAQVLAVCLFLMQVNYEEFFSDAYVENLKRLAFGGVGVSYVADPKPESH